MPLHLCSHRIIRNSTLPSAFSIHLRDLAAVQYLSSRGLSSLGPRCNSSRWVQSGLGFDRQVHTYITSTADIWSPAATVIYSPIKASARHNIKRTTRTVRKHDLDYSGLSLKESPSDTLVAALEESGHAIAVPPKFKKKVDLSRVSPFSSKAKYKAGENIRSGIAIPKSVPRENAAISLPHITALYLRLVNPLLKVVHSQHPESHDQAALDRALLQVFDKDATAYLHARGYEPFDLDVWVWILTARDSDQAALRLLVISSAYGEDRNTTSKKVPTFVFLFLLRRAQITARALRYLLIHAWSRLHNRHDVWILRDAQMEDALNGSPREKSRDLLVAPDATYPQMSEPTIMTMVVRLMRHARKVWPAAINSIALMVAKYVNGSYADCDCVKPKDMSRDVSIRLNKLYNRVLSLLSIPSSEHPLRSVPYHQQAQLSILRRMNEFHPALVLNREGYRSVIQVQLAHRKTHQESEWAKLKAKSWPPWKEEKLGIDADKGVEMGISRARQSMARLKEAGYGGQSFENAANIFSGWDTDHSPTIQTRTILRKHPQINRVHVQNEGETSRRVGENSGDVWAARIRSTRTVDEAWACFLAFKGSNLPPLQNVYYAMFEKLVSDRLRLAREKNRLGQLSKGIEDKSRTAKVLPGDGKEVFPSPSPKEAIYLHSPIPSLKILFRRMLGDGIKPSGRCLAFLLGNAESFNTGIDYLRSSSLPPHVIRILVDENVSDISDVGHSLGLLPDYLFAAHIRFLSHSRSWRLGLRSTDSEILQQVGTTISVATEPQRKSPLSYQTFLQNSARQAFRLMSIVKPNYRPPWNSLFAALSRPISGSGTNTYTDDTIINDIFSWKLALDLCRQMKDIRLEPDYQQFQFMCVCLEKAIWASHRILARKIQTPISDQEKYNLSHGTPTKSMTRLVLEAQLVRDSGLGMTKAIFNQKISLGFNSNKQEGIEEDLKLISKGGMLPLPELRIPRLLDIPSPAQLHAFIRVLGLCKDYDGILGLAKWMADFSWELKSVVDELQGGSRLMRRSLVAIRVFLEQSWMHHGSAANAELEDNEDNFVREESREGASERIVQKVYEAIEGVEHWGGWPNDEEVEAYCRKGRFL